MNPNQKHKAEIQKKIDQNKLALQVQSMVNFWYADHNLSIIDVVKGVFGRDNQKTFLTAIKEYSIINIHQLFVILNSQQKGKVCKWLIENYENKTITQIKEDYL